MENSGDSLILSEIKSIMIEGDQAAMTTYLNELLQKDCDTAFRILGKLGMRPTINTPGQDDEKSRVN